MTFSDKRIAFVGGGNMAAALIGGLLNAGWRPDQFVVVEPSSDQREGLRARFSVATVDIPEKIEFAVDVVLWAVKPQMLSMVAQRSASRFHDALSISIVSGIHLETLCAWFGTDRVIRTMPNTPAQISRGVTGMLASDGASSDDRVLSEQIMSAVGKVYWVASDDEINSICAVTGSGPGYVFYFLEAMQEAAESLGFSKEQAREMVLLNAEGSVMQALADPESFETLRARVTSKGGTTAAAIAVMSQGRMREVIAEAMVAAKVRAWEMGDGR